MKFCFCTDAFGSIEWLDLAPRLHIDDCFKIRNCHWGPCDLLLSSHQILLLEERSGISESNGFRRSIVVSFYLFLGFYWLGFPQVSLIYHQPTQTLALERCHCQVHFPALKSEFHLLLVKKMRLKKIVSKVFLKSMKIQRTNLTSPEPQ